MDGVGQDVGRVRLGEDACPQLVKCNIYINIYHIILIYINHIGMDGVGQDVGRVRVGEDACPQSVNCNIYIYIYKSY